MIYTNIIFKFVISFKNSRHERVDNFIKHNCYIVIYLSLDQGGLDL